MFGNKHTSQKTVLNDPYYVYSLVYKAGHSSICKITSETLIVSNETNSEYTDITGCKVTKVCSEKNAKCKEKYNRARPCTDYQG